ncbi:hypothetical protein BJV77DRAFT_1182556 [Russula vinacea]|nr:hypothetical protein BJV77DRAFT_1182556 [Russula vinacea]
MFFKSFIAPIFLLALTSSVNAHAAIAPALGVKGNPARSDVQRPSQAKPCGNINIAQNLGNSTAVNVNAKGIFTANITGFDPGADGSRSIKTVQVDASGNGTHFVPAQILTNGDPNPAAVGTQELRVQIPADTKCTGGTSKSLCLASFTTTAGFGNCVVVSQGAGAAKGIRAADVAAAKGDHKSPGKRDDASKKGETSRTDKTPKTGQTPKGDTSSKKDKAKLPMKGEMPNRPKKITITKKDAAIRNDNVSKKGDPSKKVDLSEKDAASKKVDANKGDAKESDKNNDKNDKKKSKHANKAPDNAQDIRVTDVAAVETKLTNHGHGDGHGEPKNVFRPKHNNGTMNEEGTKDRKNNLKKGKHAKKAQDNAQDKPPAVNGHTHKRNWSSRKLVMQSMN